MTTEQEITKPSIECGICYEILTRGQDAIVMKLKCKHWTCVKCYYKTRNRTCSFCRQLTTFVVTNSKSTILRPNEGVVIYTCNYAQSRHHSETHICQKIWKVYE